MMPEFGALARSARAWQVVVLALVAATSSAGIAPAQTNYYWDGGSGTWDTTTTTKWHSPNPMNGTTAYASSSSSSAFIGDVLTGGTSGTLTLAGNITAGQINIDATGYTIATSGTSARTLSGPIAIANGVNLTLAPIDAAALTVGSISLQSGATTATLTLGGDTTATQAVRVSLGTNATVGVPVTISTTGLGVSGFVGVAAGATINGAITNNSPVPTMIGATSALTVSQPVGGSAGLRFSIAGSGTGGAGTITLNAKNTYAGPTSFNNAPAGTVKLGLSDALPTGTDVTMAFSGTNGGSFDLNGFNQTIGSLTTGAGTGNGVIMNGAASTSTLTINGSATPAACSNALADSGTGKVALVRAGTGSTTLSATNTYSGGTTINSGTLMANTPTTGSATGSGKIDVNSGGILGGTGRAGGGNDVITIFGGGTLAPGTSATTGLTLLNTLYLKANSVFSVIANDTTSSSATMTSGNPIDFSDSGPKTIKIFSDGNLLLNNQLHTITIATVSGASFSGNPSQFVVQAGNFPGISSYSMTVNGSNLQVSFSPVPEPAAVLFLCATGAAATELVRRRHRRSAC